MAAHTAHTTRQLRMGKIYVKEVGDDVSAKDGYQAKLNFSPLNDRYASKLITMNYTWHSARVRALSAVHAQTTYRELPDFQQPYLASVLDSSDKESTALLSYRRQGTRNIFRSLNRISRTDRSGLLPARRQRFIFSLILIDDTYLRRKF